MTDNWILIYSTNKEYQAELIRQRLLNEGIESRIMNKHDSSYPVIGDIEIYVLEADASKSTELIKEFESE